MLDRLRRFWFWTRSAAIQAVRRLVAYPVLTYHLRTDDRTHVIARVIGAETRGEYLEIRDIDGRLHLIRLDAVVSFLPARKVEARNFRVLPIEGAA